MTFNVESFVFEKNDVDQTHNCQENVLGRFHMFTYCY